MLLVVASIFQLSWLNNLIWTLIVVYVVSSISSSTAAEKLSSKYIKTGTNMSFKTGTINMSLGHLMLRTATCFFQPYVDRFFTNIRCTASQVLFYFKRQVAGTKSLNF